jgi:hypothetical protein
MISPFIGYILIFKTDYLWMESVSGQTLCQAAFFKRDKGFDGTSRRRQMPQSFSHFSKIRKIFGDNSKRRMRSMLPRSLRRCPAPS